MATTYFPDTKIDENVVTRKPQGPIDTTIEAVVVKINQMKLLDLGTLPDN